jgi:hypothetical protein
MVDPVTPQSRSPLAVMLSPVSTLMRMPSMSNCKGFEVDRIMMPEGLSWRLRLVPNCLVSDLLPFRLLS